MKELLAIGYGDIAARLFERLSQQPAGSGWRLRGLCRQPQQKRPINGVELVAADASEQEQLGQYLSSATHSIIVTLTPRDYSAAGYRQGYVVPCQAIQAAVAKYAPQARVFYISSTGVYGQSDDQWVDEQSPAQPDDANAQQLRQAEQLIERLPQHTLLRCAGIYGRERARLLDNIANATSTHPQHAPAGFSNRIHIEDLISALTHVLTLSQPANCYNVCDNEPSRHHQVYAWLAEQLGVDDAAIIYDQQPPKRGSKRCRNQRLRDSGWQPHYPSFREGYSALLNDDSKRRQ
ncbi:NAD-dependent epimerase/dehydratase family protein [Idiomarina xiamenensis]|uniref:NAD-dependent epimerase/dehydratase n=1 Tax=Idiomarina xiamenensis 10-D-4 TaxID=740709 RepID=K2K853_9GAMM|nr:NAD-dependent epimerase/dehydratase family protein [Idiomarina xiamenensis]EKE83903.1 NAD-dependent epimerase/dehydratase [Idiomarina xiamenensis 10-D-4]